MKSHFIALFCSLVWCLSQAEERTSMGPRGHFFFDSPRLEDSAEVPHILESNTRDVVLEQENDLQKNAAYYNFVKSDQDGTEPKFERKIRIFSRPQEVLQMRDDQYKPLRDFFLRQLESKDARLSEERFDIEKGMDIDSNENFKTDKFLPKLLKDSITAWPIHMSPERKISLLGKSIWKKKSHVSEFDGAGENKNAEKISNDNETTAFVNTSIENPDTVTDSIHNANVSLNMTKAAGDVKVMEMSTVKIMEEPHTTNKTYVETKETYSESSTSKTLFPFSKSMIPESNSSDIATDIKAASESVSPDEEETRSKSVDNVEMFSSSLEKGPMHLRNEPLHQSFLYKSLDLRPVKFFPTAEHDFIMPNEDAVKENQRKKESPLMSFRMPIKESAGPDLFPSSAFEDEIKIPFFYVDS